MIHAKHSRIHDFFIGRPVDRLMRCVFRSVRIMDQLPPGDGSILLIANHFSWWDGFIARFVNQRVFGRRMHVMMLEEELEKRPFLGRLGAFSIKKNSRDALQSVDYAIRMLHDDNNMVLLFPQGAFQSTHRYPLTFQTGWYRILKKAPDNTRLFFMATLSDFFQYKRPGLYIYLAEAPGLIGTGDTSGSEPGSAPASELFASATAAEKAYNAFLQDAIARQDQLAKRPGGPIGPTS